MRYQIHEKWGDQFFKMTIIWVSKLHASINYNIFKIYFLDDLKLAVPIFNFEIIKYISKIKLKYIPISKNKLMKLAFQNLFFWKKKKKANRVQKGKKRTIKGNWVCLN